MSQITQYTDLNPEDLKNVSGIYRITNKINKKHYIGYATDLRGRIHNHINKLIKNKHQNRYLQESVNKYGIGNFEFEIIEICEERELPIRENHWALTLETHDKNKGYNLKETGIDRKVRLSKDTIKKLAAARIGKTLKERTKNLIRIAIREFHSLDGSIEKIKENSREKRGRRVIALDLKGTFVGEYRSLVEASEELNITKGMISHSLKKIGNRAGNYIFIPKKQYRENTEYNASHHGGIKKHIEVYNIEEDKTIIYCGIMDFCKKEDMIFYNLSYKLTKDKIYKDKKFIIKYADKQENKRDSYL